jgi:hypothetical protein
VEEGLGRGGVCLVLLVRDVRAGGRQGPCIHAAGHVASVHRG